MFTPKDFTYALPKSSIAQTPAAPRDSAKMMLIDRDKQKINHKVFGDLTSLLTKDDVLVLNNSKVFPARLHGKKSTGGVVEILLLRPVGIDTWEAMSKGLKPTQIVYFPHGLTGQMVDKNNQTGYITFKFDTSRLKSSNSVDDIIDGIGLTPIPPYIHSPLSEKRLRLEYQNVYALEKGSAAAPTAGMHFTRELLTNLQKIGVQIEYVTLHVGPGTFAKLRSEQIESKTLHHEWYSIDPQTADRLNAAKQQGKRIIAVGTTTCRVLESATSHSTLHTSHSSTTLFIMPPHQFNFVDALITNFHLPESSLLMLVSAFASHPNTKHTFTTFPDSIIGTAYQQAIEHEYRFFSFGDAMFIC